MMVAVEQVINKRRNNMSPLRDLKTAVIYKPERLPLL